MSQGGIENRFGGVGFKRANPNAKHLRWAAVERANLNRTVADRNTRWPEGFDPVAAGVIFD